MILNDNKRIFKLSLPLIVVMSTLFWIICYYIPNFDVIYYVLTTSLLFILYFYSYPFGSKISFTGILIFGLYMSSISIIGIFVSGNPLHVVQIAVYLFGPLLFFLAGYNSSPQYITRILVVILSIVFLFTFMERLEFWFGLNFFNLTDFSTQVKYASINDSRDPAIGRATGLFINPNQLGFFAGCAMFSILTLSRGRSNGSILIFLISTITILVSGSRGSMLAFFIASMVYIFSDRSYRIIIGIVSSGAITYFIYTFFISHGTSNVDAFMSRILFDSGFDGDSMSERIYFWTNIFDRVNILTGTLEPPELALGHAIDSFYMRLIAQAGILGLVSGCYLFFAQYMESKSLSSDFSKAGFRGMLVFVAVNSISMLGLLGLEAVFVWAVFGCVARHAGNDRAGQARRVGG